MSKKMLSEMVKFTSQHRALYCYLIMSVWIFLIVAGMYKYIATEEDVSMPKQSAYRREHRHNAKADRYKKISSKYCNAAENINLGSEGLADESWALQGVMVVIRHGDRGPLTHVKGIESVDCNVASSSQLLHRYQEYITNMTALGKAPWSQSPGPFHNLPLLPSSPPGACRLGQLTPRGLLQLLATGHVLGQAYTNKLGWDFYGNKTENKDIASSNAAPKSTGNTNINEVTKKSQSNTVPLKIITSEDAKSSTPSGKPAEGEILVHSTRYRRALQSALALLWAALGEAGGNAAGGGGGVGGAVARESPSLTFCSEDCACPAAEYYARKVSQESKKRLEAHPAVGELVTQLSSIVFQSPSQFSKDPHILEDALLAYLCHSAALPCLEKPVEDPANPNLSKNDNHKSAIDNSKPANGGLRGLLQAKKPAILYSRKDLKHSISRSLLQVFSVDDFEKANKDPGFVRKIHDVKMRPEESHRKSAILDFDSQMEKEKIGYYQQKMMENVDMNYEDVILIKRNMDGDFNFNGENINNPEVEDDDSEDYNEKDENEKDTLKKSDTETLCVKKEQVSSLFAYTDWDMKQYAKSSHLKKASLLRAFGMIRQIVKYILKMISEGKPKFVLFSGHDKTLQFLSLALGLADESFLSIHYASRMVIEIYKNEDKEYMKNKKSPSGRIDSRKPKVVAPLDFFLRVVMNGVDVTHQLSFCRGSRSIVADNLMKVNGLADEKKKSYLCRIENIIRFTHEDYFSVFNASNFKDACTVRKV